MLTLEFPHFFFIAGVFGDGGAVKVLHSFRIHIHGMFVYGFDHDDWQTVKNTVKFAKKSRLNSTII